MKKPKSFTPSQIAQSIRKDDFCAYLPISLAAEVMGMTKVGLTRQAGQPDSPLEMVTITSTKGTTWTGFSVTSIRKALSKKEDLEQNLPERTFKLLNNLAINPSQPLQFYGAFMEQLGLSVKNPRHRTRNGKVIGNINMGMYHKHNLMPGALVVNKTTGLPSHPFFNFAKRMGEFKPESQTKKAFCEDQIKKLKKAALKPKVWKWDPSYDHP